MGDRQHKRSDAIAGKVRRVAPPLASRWIGPAQYELERGSEEQAERGEQRGAGEHGRRKDGEDIRRQLLVARAGRSSAVGPFHESRREKHTPSDENERHRGPRASNLGDEGPAALTIVPAQPQEEADAHGKQDEEGNTDD